MWRYLINNCSNNDDMYFISYEARLALLSYANRLSKVNSQIDATAQITSYFLLKSSHHANSIGESNQLNYYLLYLNHLRFVNQRVFSRSSEFFIMTLVSAWSVNMKTSLTNDLCYFGTLFSRYAFLKGTSLKYPHNLFNNSQKFLELTDRFTLHAFWYHRKIMYSEIFRKPYFTYQLFVLSQIFDTWGSYHYFINFTEYYTNCSLLSQTPRAFSEALFIETI